MTIPPLQGGGMGAPAFRIPVLTAPISTGVPSLINDDEIGLHPDTSSSPIAPTTARADAPISLAGRLEAGDVLPETTQLALALESATRALQNSRPDLVLRELDAVWSNQLTADSPWYLRTAALQLLGRTSDAEQVLRDAIALLPRSAAMLYLLGVHTSHRGQTDAARLVNDHALALHPTEPLLWLQRAALAQRSAAHETAMDILGHVQSMESTLPASHWLATLARLGDPSLHRATPAVQRALTRLTPSTVPAIESGVLALVPHSPEQPVSVLETALRYGLTLLESPTQSARKATAHSVSGTTVTDIGAMMSAASSLASARVELPTWETLVLVTGLMVIAFVPSLRIPALLVTGVVAMLIVSRRMH